MFITLQYTGSISYSVKVLLVLCYNYFRYEYHSRKTEVSISASLPSMIVAFVGNRYCWIGSMTNASRETANLRLQNSTRAPINRRTFGEAIVLKD